MTDFKIKTEGGDIITVSESGYISGDDGSSVLVLGEVTEGVSGDLSVNILSTNSYITEGEQLKVNVEVTNNESQTVDGSVIMSADGTEVTAKSVTLVDGETREITLVWNTSSGDAGIYTMKVESSTDSDTAEVRVEDAPAGEGDFDITITSTNSPISPGEDAQIGFEIANNLSEQQDGQAVLTIDGVRKDSIDVSLGADDSTLYTLLWDTPSDASPDEYLACISSGVDVDCDVVEVVDDTEATVSNTPSNESWFGCSEDASEVFITSSDPQVPYNAEVTNDESSEATISLELYDTTVGQMVTTDEHTFGAGETKQIGEGTGILEATSMPSPPGKCDSCEVRTLEIRAGTGTGEFDMAVVYDQDSLYGVGDCS